MTNKNFKKQREFLSVMPLMKTLGYDVHQAESLLRPSEKPDFLLDYGKECIGVEITECHPEITKGKHAKNQRAAQQRTSEIHRSIEKILDSQGIVVNYKIGLNFSLLFELQNPHLKKSEIEIIQNKVLSEIQRRINNGDYIKSGTNLNKLDKECVKKYYYTRYIIVDEPLERSLLSFSYPGRSLLTIKNNVVLNAISKKDAKLSSYRNNYPEIKEFWLCIYVPLETNYTIDGIQELKVRSLFDRVYLISDIKCMRIK